MLNWGWNRDQDEGRIAHFKRLWASNYHAESKDHAMPSLTHCAVLEFNDKYVTHPDTYYFSITQGYRQPHRKPKNRELFKLPFKLSRKSLSFESGVLSRIQLK